ncbi:DEAD/DEAH box helicase [Fulvivirga ulvae]|uniref:DEAD/DEAH box helicase n=1 Tax=Fulvivirga ulvae TaxID=2904245 RepID=UPI001F208CA0|nr:DEAD/DEAH box helicase [Fulvivirga ulvae]UII32156.1 DEAD/DEAH box helicase [Fulvivirga ulvae]
MKLSEAHSQVISELLSIEHKAIADKLGLVETKGNKIDDALMKRSVALLDELSRDSENRKVVIIAAAILWTYRENHWEGLKDFLIVTLCRVGFPPSSIMIDSEFDQRTGRYGGTNSLIDQFAITIHQLNHEIFVGNRKFLVTNFQKSVWDKFDMVKLLGVSAPTSAGKSFIILLKCIDLILKNGGSIIYIVPTLSLVAQVSADFNSQLKAFQLTRYKICTTYNSEDIEQDSVYILTQEKAISAFSQTEQPFQNVAVLVVDEIQNIEKVPFEGDQRAKTLYDTLIEFRHSTTTNLTILSGPRVEGLKQLGVEIFDEREVDEEKTNDSPVASFTYAISKKGSSYSFNQYSDVLTKPNRLTITNSNLIKGYGGARYQNDFIEYLSAFTNNLGEQSRNIIFSPTTSQARNTAVQLAKLKEPTKGFHEVDSLVNYIKETVHNDYDMCSTIPKGIVYHHGKTPSHVRAVVEHAIRNKTISNVVCTTTLMQGVNLPAQNVIMRNPDLAIRAEKGVKPKLTDYEIANLRGRAGRLLKDFIGRTFILEENSFERASEQAELFPEAEKMLRSGYGEKYNQFKKEIQKGLSENVVQNDNNKEYAFLMTYIRQNILRHKENSFQRLMTVGIDIGEDRLQEIYDYLQNQLSIPHDLCYKNRYWDPLDLDALYQRRNLYNIPTAINEINTEQKLTTLLTQILNEFPQYYQRYFNVAEGLLYSACITAKEWMKETPLKQILSTAYFDNSNKIDDRIALIQRDISYGLPMLLKPIYDIKASGNMFLRFIEIGAYMPITRKMIELNIPRETAISLNNQYFRNFNLSDINQQNQIINRLREVKDDVDYWRRIQLEAVV